MSRSEKQWICDCGYGSWFPSWVYADWCARNNRVHFPDESGESGDCPECGGVLEKSLVGKGLAYSIFRCRRCGGFRMDAEQSAQLNEKVIDEELHGIYGTIARRNEEKRTRERTVPQLQDDDTQYIQISKKKPFYHISSDLRSYLEEYGRACDLPPIYDELSNFSSAFPCMDPDGNDTLWQTVGYNPARWHELKQHLSGIYSQLKTGNPEAISHLNVARIDFCDFGNSKPFRVRVVNEHNDNYDHFYVKVPDASRVYGLELEHILSPNAINYLVHEHTLIEDHIAGIPGDVFVREQIHNSRKFDQVRMAKEFVKFSQRCFVRLLGDMRSYNYVVDITPDFEESQFRVRAMDFDQQSYEGELTIYDPKHYKENAAVRQLCAELINEPTIKQYTRE
ncbi:MAG: hypothetical protein AAF585_23675, partial [Verrucomicrobiota bacterium]